MPKQNNMLGARMPASPRFDDIDLLEQIVLPISNLRHSLEAQLEEGSTVDLEQFLMGLNSIQSKASALQVRLRASSCNDGREEGVRKLAEILRNFSNECSPGKKPAQLTS